MEMNHPTTINTSESTEQQFSQMLNDDAGRDMINRAVARARNRRKGQLIHASKKKAARRKANKVASMHRRKNRA